MLVRSRVIHGSDSSDCPHTARKPPSFCDPRILKPISTRSRFELFQMEPIALFGSAGVARGYDASGSALTRRQPAWDYAGEAAGILDMIFLPRRKFAGI